MMKARRQMSHRGFTMIELLVVVLIIALLSGILLKAASALQDKGAKASGTAEMEILSNLLSAFKAEYGTYPPASSMTYEFESRTNQTAGFQGFLKSHNDPNDPGSFFPDCDDRLGSAGDTHWPLATRWTDSLGYRYGLVSFLWPRLRNASSQPHWLDYDTDRDEAAKDSWADLCAKVGLSEGQAPHKPPSGLESLQPYTNSTSTVTDPWGRSYRYRCITPFTRYRLWSAGPNGKDGDGDDLDYEKGAGIF
jgi:prepilin-type N-terminal cleavage/methylation domain-containing protein